MDTKRGVLVEYTAKETPSGREWGVFKTVVELNAEGVHTETVEPLATGVTPRAANANDKEGA